MSVSFSVANAPESIVPEECFTCWQLEDMGEEADPDCVLCGGSGFYDVPKSCAPECNFANDHAKALMSLLGLTLADSDGCWVGEIPASGIGLVLTMARGLLGDEGLRIDMCREPSDAHKHGPRVIFFGSDDDDAQRRIGEFVEVLVAAKKLGKPVCWA